MGIGEENAIVFKGEHIKENTLTLISKNEKVTVLAGEFDDCMHIRLKGTNYWGRDLYTADVYYAKNIGLVKAEFAGEGKAVENYELSEYKISGENSGSVYFPLAIGNVWRYVNTNLQSIYWQLVEYDLININPVENDGVDAYFSSIRYVRLKKLESFYDDCDSDTYIDLADTIVTGAPDIKYFDDAIRYLKFALRKNSSVRASIFSIKALEHLIKCREYKAKNYRFLPTRTNSNLINKTDGKINYKEWGGYDVAPHRMGSRHEENKIFGMKPFRFLQQLAGTLFDENWIAGYSETKKTDDGDLYITVENGGTITVKAGTFENCLKVTFSLEVEPNDGKRDYFRDFKYTHCGTKIYYYAPNVGIVKHDSIWGDSTTSEWPLSSICELTEYNSIATDGEYMPIYIGNKWVYDEMTIEPGYKASETYDIVSGIEDEFFMITTQDFLYMGTEEEYEEFKKNLKK
jgi:hypothetical protein